MTLALSLLVIIMFAGVVRIAASWLANLDEADRDAAESNVIARRYSEPTSTRSWT